MTAAEVLHLKRDYHTEMRQVIDTYIADAVATHGEYNPPLVATDIVDKLQANDPDLLDGWLHAQATEFVREMIGRIGRSARHNAQRQQPRREFAAAVEKHKSGDSTKLRKYSELPFAVPGGQKPLGKLNRDELVYAKGTYVQRAEQNKFKAVLLGKLLQKVTADSTVEDHYTEDQLAVMFKDFGR